MPEIVCKATGQVLDEENVDALLAHWEYIKARKEECEATMALIAIAVAKKAKGNGRTLRVRGEHRRVRVELPMETFDQGILKELWTSCPAAYEFLRVERIAVNKVEFNKLVNETGTPEFEAMKAKLIAARRAPQGLPRLFLES